MLIKSNSKYTAMNCLIFVVFVVGVANANTLFFERQDLDIICPDKQGSCPSDSTCCQLPSGKYACCPLPQATCCSDHLHCCPSGYKCDVSAGTCSRGSESISWLDKVKPKPLLEDVVCPGSQQSCPSGQTCCQLSSGDYGCCPMINAVCCSDHLHCCPDGYTCDVSGGKCNKGLESISWSDKVKAKSLQNDIVCPGGQQSCPDGQTCCQLSSGDFGCCPMPQATCCSDHLHCCPNGYTCNLAAGTCNRGLESIDWFKKGNAQTINKRENGVCPDQQSSCPDSSTCCQLASGGWGCCPLQNAVCCSDHLHCCPTGNTCDVAHSRCVSKSEDSVPWFNSQDGMDMPGKIMCDDHTTYCTDSQTCCKTKSGYGCCPYPNAGCCGDEVNCCKHTCLNIFGYHCWIDKTLKIRSTIPVDKKEPAKKVVWCDDAQHFCPEGFQCNNIKETCVRKVISSVPWSLKVPATQLPNVCTNSKKKCASDMKCCQSDDGTNGCCPFENGICCSDGNHCCPDETTCDLKSQMCKSISANIAVGLYLTDKKSFGKTLAKKKSIVHCPDETDCPDSTTCCKMQNDRFSCCQYANAVCCDDLLHCCPEGYQCDVEHSACIQDSSSIQLPWDLFVRKRAKLSVSDHIASVVCPMDTHNCPNNNTCCQMTDQNENISWNCCPHPNALCCGEGDHCCPVGFACDNLTKSCIQEATPNNNMKEIEKVSHIP